ncbi:PREDICTED: A-kinase anchor protein 13-like [Myotis davidii]|uniref:A-kinase anchor protein 13-like n=1 Tax=Myotis davidii TaxID=225400 RepID=UPI0007672B67|nr:PREDICTED: A-kinase anchor protein 13-like [Myotis davidii]
MDNLMPLMVTAQDPSGLLTAQDADGSFLPCTSASTDSPQPSSPPAGAESSPCGLGITAVQVERLSDASSAGKEENTDRSCRKKNKGVERKEEEAEPTVDSETRSNPQSCLQSMSDCGEKGKEGLPPCEIGSEETQAKPITAATAPGSLSLSSGGAALPGVTLMESGPAPHFPAGEQEGRSTGDAGVPETAEGAERGLRNPDATTQKVLTAAGERTKERLENSHVGAAGASHVKDTRQPVDKAMVPNCVSATSSLDGETPAESVLVLSHGGAPIEKTAETETSRRCDASAGDQSPASVPAAANGKMDAPLAHTGGAVSSADLPFPRPQKDALPKEKAETNSPHLQSQNDQPPICSPPRDDQPRAAPAGGQSTVTSSGALAAEHRDDTVTQPGGSATGPPHAQPPPTAVCPEGPQAETATPDPGGDTQEDVGFCPLEVLDTGGQTGGVNSQTPLTNALEVELHPHAVVPKAQREPVPGQAVTSGRTFSPAGSADSESVTRDDALSLVPSQNEKGTAAPQPLTATDGRDGGDWRDPDKQPLEDRAAGLPTPPAALDPQPSMGNASPGGFGEEQEDPCLPAAPEVRNMEGGTDSSRLHVAEAPLASDSSSTEEGNSPVVPESSAAQGQGDRFKAVICSSTQEDTPPSGALREEQGTDPPRQESPGDQGEPGAAACARDKALEHGGSRGTPWACLNAETKHNKEVAPPASLLTEGGAAQSPVPPGAGLATDAGQEAGGAEQSSSPRLPGLSPDASRAPNCNGPSAVDGVTDAQAQGETAACEASGNMALDVAVGNALQGTAEARGTALSHSAQDLPVPEVLLRQENGIQVLPGALPDKGGTDLQGAAAPETVPPVWEKGKPERAHLSCRRDASEEAQMNDTRSVPLQPTAKELPAEAGLSTSDDQAPSRDRGAPPVPHAVSAEAGHLPKSADSIEEAASRIVDAVIEHVRASGALLTEGDISHLPPSSPAEAGPRADQLESASAGKVHALLPGETPPAGSTREETPRSSAGCSAGREEPEKIIPLVPGPEPATEMPDTKADDEVDFLRNPRQSSVSEEAAGGDTAAPSGTRPGLKTPSRLQGT